MHPPTVRAPTTAQLIEAWDLAFPRPALERAETLLALASPDADAAALDALTLGERERRLLAVRAAAFGSKITGLTACEACGEPLELELAVDELLGLTAPAPGEILLNHGDCTLSLRLPNGADLRAAAQAPAGAAAAVLLARCVSRAERNGAPVDAAKLPAGVAEAAGEALAQADPLADLRLGLSCVACDHAWRAPFDAAGFLWAELDAWAGRLLREVHTLASAYGWTERDILALSPARRARYLDMVAG